MGKIIKSSPNVSVFLQVRMSQYITCPLGKGDKTAKASGCLFTYWLCIKPKLGTEKQPCSFSGKNLTLFFIFKKMFTPHTLRKTGTKSVTGTIPSQ